MSDFRDPKLKRQADAPIIKAETEFYGMHKGIPASEIDAIHSARDVNLIAYGKYKQVRPGSKLYTEQRMADRFTADAATDILEIANDHPWVRGQRVYVWADPGDVLPGGLVNGTIYYLIPGADATHCQLATTYANCFPVAGETPVNITDAGTGDNFWVGYSPAGAVGARYDCGFIMVDDDGNDRFILAFLYGSDVYVTDARITEHIRVLNLNTSYLPSGTGMFSMQEKDAILATSSGIFRIILDDNDFYYMYRVNIPLPIVRITDVDYVAATLTYGYLYIYSLTRLTGTGNRNRLSSSTKIVLETGTIKVPGEERDYGEVYFATPIGEPIATNHVVGNFTVPDTVDEATHFSVYRTKNIGQESGGVNPTVEGQGNRSDQFVWTDDIPVAKAWVVTVAANVATRQAGDNDFVRGDAGCAFRARNSATEVLSATTINTWNAAANVTVAALANATYYACIGHGRLFGATQVGVIVTCNNPAAGIFDPADKGLTIFRSDGGYTYIKEYISATQVEAAYDEAWADLACTMKPDGGADFPATNFYRKFNDTVRDDGVDEYAAGGVDLIGLEQRIDSNLDVYVPRRFFDPLPNCDNIAIDSGYAVTCTRDESVYYYSQIGDKPYTICFYRNPNQTRKLGAEVRLLLVFPSLAVILCVNRTYVLPLNNSVDVGKNEIGESVFQLNEAILADDVRGVVAWPTVQYKGVNLIIAVTNEPAIRFFDGHSWSKENLAIDLSTGDDAVQSSDIEHIDQEQRAIACYSRMGGYKLFFKKWVES